MTAISGSAAAVTGGASGIGRALARELAARGCDLALADRDEAGLASVVAELAKSGRKVTTHRVDVSERAQIDAFAAAAIAAHPTLNILINNAGVALLGRFNEIDQAQFEWLMNINFWGVVHGTRVFLPQLSSQPAAHIVNISSIFGIIAPPGQTAYCASKFAVRGFSESLRHELETAGSGIGVTLVHPGGVRTAIAENARLSKGLSEAEIAGDRAAWRSLLALPAEDAARRIMKAIVARERRVLVGRDAIQAAWLQRLLPVDYWKHCARDIARRVKRAAPRQGDPPRAAS